MSEHRLCRLADLADPGARGFEVTDVAGTAWRLLLVRRGEHAFLYQNQCPHAGVPLDWMPDQFFDMSGSFLQCATHGALFTLEEGRCLSGPCVGDHLRALPLEARADGLWACLPTS